MRANGKLGIRSWVWVVWIGESKSIYGLLSCATTPNARTGSDGGRKWDRPFSSTAISSMKYLLVSVILSCKTTVSSCSLLLHRSDAISSQGQGRKMPIAEIAVESRKNDRHPSPSASIDSIHVNRPPLPETRHPLQRRRRRRPAISPPAKNMARQTPHQNLPRRQRIQIIHKLPTALRPSPFPPSPPKGLTVVDPTPADIIPSLFP